MNKIEHLLQQIHKYPENTEFSEVISVIDENYKYTPAKFSNGPVSSDTDEGITNEAGKNEGSCKIFAFARMNALSEDETLHCFGKYYRDDVLKHPDNDDHQNIRLFMRYGWDHIDYDSEALSL